MRRFSGIQTHPPFISLPCLPALRPDMDRPPQVVPTERSTILAPMLPGISVGSWHTWLQNSKRVGPLQARERTRPPLARFIQLTTKRPFTPHFGRCTQPLEGFIQLTTKILMTIYTSLYYTIKDVKIH